MVCSPAKLAANQANAKRSTGPKDTSRTRFNAFKHGLTASEIALPSEDQVEMERRFQDIAITLNPQNEVEAILARRFAFLSVRLDRCQRYDTAMQSHRDRHAEAAYVEARDKQVEAYAQRLGQEPVAIVRQLRATPDGLQFLGVNLMDLRDRLEGKAQRPWAMSDGSDLDDLRGEPTGPTRFNRTLILTQAVCGFFANAPAGEWPGLDDAEKSEAARTELLAIIDAEMASLKTLYDDLDHAKFAHDRAGAVDRALFDPSKDATLSRKYEASTERSLFRTLRELEKLAGMEMGPDADAALDDAVDLVIPPPEPIEPSEPVETESRPRGTVASFFHLPTSPPEAEKSRIDFPSPADVGPSTRPSDARKAPRKRDSRRRRG